MKHFILCAITAIVVVGIEAQEYPMGILISATDGKIVSTCPKSGAHCSSDCSTLLICAANVPTPLQTVTCSSPNQYCVGSACTDKPGPDCTWGASFLCTADGIFPEPSDCTKYRFCTGAVSAIYQCPDGFNFNSKINACEKGVACGKIDCSKSPNKYVLYPSNPTYFAYCLDFKNGTIQTIMFKCDFEQYEIFDLTTSQCKYNCKAKGNFQNPANCQQYYYCSAASATPTLLLCPMTYVFDGATCNADVTKCQNPPPTTTTTTTTAPIENPDEGSTEDPFG